MPIITSQSRAASDLIHLPTWTPSKRPFLPNIDRLICNRIQQVTVFAIAVGYHDTMNGHAESAKMSPRDGAFAHFIRCGLAVWFRSHLHTHTYTAVGGYVDAGDYT